MAPAAKLARRAAASCHAAGLTMRSSCQLEQGRPGHLWEGCSNAFVLHKRCQAFIDCSQVRSREQAAAVQKACEAARHADTHGYAAAVQRAHEAAWHACSHTHAAAVHKFDETTWQTSKQLQVAQRLIKQPWHLINKLKVCTKPLNSLAADAALGGISL